jgi:hypothetical protein
MFYIWFYAAIFAFVSVVGGIGGLFLLSLANIVVGK